MKAYHHPALLPGGFADLLPVDAALEAHAVAHLMARFAAFGYDRIKPPLVEFEDSLFAGPGPNRAQEAFRLMDPHSQRMMAIRSDTTPQIARIAASRMRNVSRPLRLAYANDVLRVAGTHLRPERQYCQVGCELIGSDSLEADIEIAVLALQSLSSLGVKGLAIDLTLPPLLKKILNLTLDGDRAQRRVLKEAADRRDRAALRVAGGPCAGLLDSLMAATGPAEQVVGMLATLPLPWEAMQDVRRLADVAGGILKALQEMEIDDVSVTIDPLERKGFHYESGVSFTLFAREVRGELGRGGRYAAAFASGSHFASSESATGFTVYMDSVCRSLPLLPTAQKTSVPSATSWADILKKQGKGQVIVRDLSGTGHSSLS